MTIVETKPDKDQTIRKLAAQVVELKSEIGALNAQLDGNIPKATEWLQSKVWRQRLALDTLNRRVVTQRFILRTLNELGRDLTREEYIQARDAQREGLKDRIAEESA